MASGAVFSKYKHDLIQKAIPKAELKDGVMYAGLCRNATVATWNAKTDSFVYVRTKFGTKYLEAVPHFEDEAGFDVFIPERELEKST